MTHRHTIRLLTGTLGITVLAFVAGCASIGTPDGGPFDEDPPVILGSTPLPGARNIKSPKVVIDFDEYIKLEKPSEKVVISPPQTNKYYLTILQLNENNT